MRRDTYITLIEELLLSCDIEEIQTFYQIIKDYVEENKDAFKKNENKRRNTRITR